jgi:hypothetical protein
MFGLTSRIRDGASGGMNIILMALALVFQSKHANAVATDAASTGAGVAVVATHAATPLASEERMAAVSMIGTLRI